MLGRTLASLAAGVRPCPVLSFLQRAAGARVRRPRHVADRELLPATGAAAAHGAVLSTALPRVLAVLPRAAGGVRVARADLLRRLRILLLLLVVLGRARAAVRRDGGRALPPGVRSARGRDRLERRLPAPVLRRARR